jgi:hypothetical protein
MVRRSRKKENAGRCGMQVVAVWSLLAVWEGCRKTERRRGHERQLIADLRHNLGICGPLHAAGDWYKQLHVIRSWVAFSGGIAPASTITHVLQRTLPPWSESLRVCCSLANHNGGTTAKHPAFGSWLTNSCCACWFVFLLFAGHKFSFLRTVESGMRRGCHEN